MPLALLALTLSAFAIGTTEFVIVGLVPTIAQDLSVSLPSAGLLVSLYAVGVAIGAPVLTAMTGRFNRKLVLLALMMVFEGHQPQGFFPVFGLIVLLYPQHPAIDIDAVIFQQGALVVIAHAAPSGDKRRDQHSEADQRK